MPIAPATEAEAKAEQSDNLVKDLYTGTAEKTVQESSWVGKSLLKPFNPDDLYQKTGDYSIYEDMQNDDQISVAMQLKRDLVLGSGWTIVTESDKDQEIADALYVDLEEEPDVSLDDMLDDFLDNAWSYGFALAEKIFKIKDDNTLALKAIKTRHPNSWLIHTDLHGNVEKFEQQGVRGNLDINPDSLMHYVNSQRFQNPYGTSDLRKAFDAWFTKRHIIRFYSIFLEKNASPIPVARYDKGIPGAKVTEIFNVIKSFQQKTAMAVPKDFEIEFLEAKSNGEAYIKGLNLFNMFIGRALVIPDLLGFQGGETGGGSLALGKSQIDVFYKHIMRRRRTLERLVNKHIVQPLAVWNHGMMESYPKFQLNPISEDNALEYAKTFLELTKGKLYKHTEAEINHFKDLIRFPTSDEIEFIEAGSAGGGQMPQFDEDGNPIPPQRNPGEPPAEGLGDQKKARPDNEVGSEKKDDDKDKPQVEFINLGHYAYKKPDGDFHKRVDFKALEATLISDEKTIMAEVRPIVEDIFEDLFDQIERKNILGPNPKPERIDSISVKGLKKLQLALKKNLRRSYVDQRAIARKELFKQSFAQPLPSHKFLEVLDEETFQYVGDWEFAISKRVRLELMNAIKDGRPLSSVIGVLDDEGKRLSDVSLERFSRTKLTEVMNRARLEEFENSKVVAGYQYSAILDDRTTDVCAGLHGKIFKAGDECVPPLHFNCRSTLIPITIFEEFTPDTKVGSKPIQQFIEDNKGDGFATK